ncbi:DNase I-like protein [Dioscorea alata]|uniref:DNase I-like protein n=1 Tax=Dioscorea alata TaxID=55571 RepID=A0ACB7WU28_DIOAL|nr:DNase I-like protein [Dioscorea alata]
MEENEQLMDVEIGFAINHLDEHDISIKNRDKGGPCGSSPPTITSLLSWNCRGLGNPRAVQVLLDLVKEKKAYFIFLIETHYARSKLKALKSKLAMEGPFVVDSVGRSRVTSYYGELNRNRSSISQNLLRAFSSKSSLPWLCVGDYNDVLASSEKKGDLFDLKMDGYEFTWQHGKGTRALVEEKLDRAMASHDWIAMFTNYQVMNLPYTSSDHSLLLMKTQGKQG